MEAEVLPRDDDEDRVEDDVRVASHSCTCPPARPLHRAVDQATRLQQQAPDDRRDDVGQHERQEESSRSSARPRIRWLSRTASRRGQAAATGPGSARRAARPGTPGRRRRRGSSAGRRTRRAARGRSSRSRCRRPPGRSAAAPAARRAAAPGAGRQAIVTRFRHAAPAAGHRSPRWWCRRGGWAVGVRRRPATAPDRGRRSSTNSHQPPAASAIIWVTSSGRPARRRAARRRR